MAEKKPKSSKAKNDKLQKANDEARASINPMSEVAQLMIKVYPEQLIRTMGTALENDTIHRYVTQIFEQCKNPDGTSKFDKDNPMDDDTRDKVRAINDELNTYAHTTCQDKGYYETFFTTIEDLDDELFEAYAILHDSDYTGKSFWDYHQDKPHIHVGIRSLKFYEQVKPRRKAFQVQRMLDLLGIVFDKKLDGDLVDNDAIAAVHYWSNYIYYLTHEDEKSMLEGKHQYGRGEIRTNSSQARYEATIRGIDTIRTRQVTIKDIAEHRKDIIDLASQGLTSHDVLTAICDMDTAVDYIETSNSLGRQFNDVYLKGAEQWIASNPRMDSHCIYIQGSPDMGKTYAFDRVTEAMGVTPDTVFIPKGTDLATFYGLTTKHKWGLFDDVPIKYILKVGDDKPCYVRCLYGFACCAIENLIIINNAPFDDYFSYYGDDEDKDKMEAVKSRFAVARITPTGGYILDKVMTRGSRTDRVYKDKEWVINFLDKFTESTKEYCKEESLPSSIIMETDCREMGLQLLKYDNIMHSPFPEDREMLKLLPLRDKFLNEMKSLYHSIDPEDPSSEFVVMQHLKDYLKDRYLFELQCLADKQYDLYSCYEDWLNDNDYAMQAYCDWCDDEPEEVGEILLTPINPDIDPNCYFENPIIFDKVEIELQNKMDFNLMLEEAYHEYVISTKDMPFLTFTEWVNKNYEKSSL